MTGKSVDPISRYKEVSKIGKEINEELATIEALFRNLVTRLAGILDISDFFSLGIYKPQTNCLELHTFEKGEHKLFEDLDLGVYKLSEWVIKNLRPLVLHDLTSGDGELPEDIEPVHLRGTDPLVRSAIFVPLSLQNRPLGLLSIQHKEANIFSEDDLEILQLLGNHVALAIHSLQLRESLRRLDETGQLLTQQLSSSNILESVVEIIRQSTGADIVILYPYDARTNSFLLPPKLSGTLMVESFTQPIRLKPDDIASLGIRLTTPLFVEKSYELYEFVGGEPRTRRGGFEVRERLKSTALIPLRLGDEPIGVLFVNYRNRQRFDAPQRWVIQSLGSYAAIAIRNSRQFADLTTRRVKEFEDLHRIGQAISRTLELEKVLKTIIDLSMEHINADRGAILLYSPKNNVLESRAIGGEFPTPKEEQRYSLDEFEGIAWQAFARRETIRVGDVRTNPNWSRYYREVSATTVSEMDIPLLLDEKCIGVMSFESIQIEAFSEEDERFMSILAGQAVVAIKNATLFQDVIIANRELEEARKRDKLAAIGELTGDLAHKINSPIAAINADIQFIKESAKDELATNHDLSELVNEIEQISVDAMKMVQGMREEARSNALQLEPVKVQSLIKSIFDDLVLPEIIDLNDYVSGNDELPAVAANMQLRNVFYNLITNAVEAMPDGGKLEIEGRVSSGKWVDVIVEDNGVGIPEGWANEIFNIFTTGEKRGTKRRGQGLGLWYSKAYVNGIGGELQAPESGKGGKGTKFTVRLPIYDLSSSLDKTG